MLQRKAYAQLLSWKQTGGRSALLIEGARRVGKSWIARTFAQNEYDHHLFIDFSIAPPELTNAFIEYGTDFDSLFQFLQAYYDVTLPPRHSLIIFDEVQQFPKARELIKHLVADGRYDYLETGSLISIRKNVAHIVIPSEEDRLNLNPLDFEEFCWALGATALADQIRAAFASRTPLPDALHTRAMRLWREYLLVGGMPQVVSTYLGGKNMEAADREKRRILRLYADDIVKFADGERGRVSSIFSEIPGQLAKHEKRFSLSALNPQARSREYSGSFFWLADARITNNCFNATNPSIGLAMSQENTTLKCYMGDTGLLVAHAFADRATTPNAVYRDILLNKLELNEGMLVENCVAQQLYASGHRLFFYSRSKNSEDGRMEIDFLIAREYDDAAMRLRISPVEVKASKGRYATASLDRFKARFGSHIGTEYVLHPKPLRNEGARMFTPLYMAHLL